MERKMVENYDAGIDTYCDKSMKKYVSCSLCSSPMNIIDDEIIIDENDFIICGWCFRNTRYV